MRFTIYRERRLPLDERLGLPARLSFSVMVEYANCQCHEEIEVPIPTGIGTEQQILQEIRKEILKRKPERERGRPSFAAKRDRKREWNAEVGRGEIHDA